MKLINIVKYLVVPIAIIFILMECAVSQRLHALVIEILAIGIKGGLTYNTGVAPPATPHIIVSICIVGLYYFFVKNWNTNNNQSVWILIGYLIPLLLWTFFLKIRIVLYSIRRINFDLHVDTCSMIGLLISIFIIQITLIRQRKTYGS